VACRCPCRWLRDCRWLLACLDPVCAARREQVAAGPPSHLLKTSLRTPNFAHDHKEDSVNINAGPSKLEATVRRARDLRGSFEFSAGAQASDRWATTTGTKHPPPLGGGGGSGPDLRRRKQLMPRSSAAECLFGTPAAQERPATTALTERPPSAGDSELSARPFVHVELFSDRPSRYLSHSSSDSLLGPRFSTHLLPRVAGGRLDPPAPPPRPSSSVLGPRIKDQRERGELERVSRTDSAAFLLSSYHW